MRHTAYCQNTAIFVFTAHSSATFLQEDFDSLRPHILLITSSALTT